MIDVKVVRIDDDNVQILISGKAQAIPIPPPTIPPVVPKTIGEMITNLDFQYDMHTDANILFMPFKNATYGLMPYNYWQVLQLIGAHIPELLPHRAGKKWEIVQGCPAYGESFPGSPSHLFNSRVFDMHYLTFHPTCDHTQIGAPMVRIWKDDGTLNLTVFDAKATAGVFLMILLAFPKATFSVNEDIARVLYPYCGAHLASRIIECPGTSNNHHLHCHVALNDKLNLEAVL